MGYECKIEHYLWKEIPLFMTTQVDLEGIVLTKVSTEKQALYDLIHMWDLKQLLSQKLRAE